MTVPDPDLMSWESEGSGESLEEWSLIRCSPNSSGIIGGDSDLLSWQKEIAKSI